MKNIGVLLGDLFSSQWAFDIIETTNRLADHQLNVSLFVLEHSMPVLVPRTGTFSALDAYGYDGPLVATNLETAQIALRTASPPSLYLWAQDLEWTRVGVFDYRTFARVYRHPRIRLLARSEDHARLLANLWNTDVAVATNFEEVIALAHA